MARRAATVILLGLASTLLVAFSARIRDYFPWAPKLPGYLWVAVMVYLVLTLAVLEVPRLFVWRRVPDEGRRLLLARGTAVAAGLVAGSTVAFGAKTALGPPMLKRVRIPLAKLPRRLDGYRIAVVSDIHLGDFTSAAYTQRIVDAINGMDADLIAIVGDLVDGQGRRCHGNADVAKAMAGRDPALPAVLLAHQPVVVHEAARHGVDLQLSGHTHGGQMFPAGLLARAYQPVISGLDKVEGTTIYVTNGAGFWGPPRACGCGA